MPRDSDGDYTLPAGNPVVTDTDIESDWANNTLDDIADAITDSLSRSGEGGMLAPFQLDDGLVSAPALTFADEQSSGLYRAGTNDIRLSVAGVDKVRWTASEVMEFNIASSWVAVEDLAGGGAASVESRSIAYTFVLDDAETVQRLTGSTGRTWLLPPNASVAFPIGTSIVCCASGSGEITIDPDTGVTLNSVFGQASTTSRVVLGGGTAVLFKVDTNEWQLTGDLR